MKSNQQTYQFKFGEREPDTELLAAMLHAEYEAILSSDLVAKLTGDGIDQDSIDSLLWYRVAERAKELRA